ncbi:MAG: TolC family protein [Prevotella sp.]|nr:TolC family protein [Prevotella sp.]
MKKNFLLITLLLICSTAYTQAVLTLDGCHQKAKDNYPLIKQYGLISLAGQYSLENISKKYLPLFSLNGQATYQSDVTKMPVDLSSLPIPNAGIPAMKKDQYKATIDATQLIWDGGAIDAQKQITKASTDVEKQKIEVSIYSIKEKVNQLYFGILVIDEQLKILDLTEATMKANRDIARSMFRNGVAMQSDLDQIDVELLNIDQNRTEQLSIRQAYLSMLGLFIHQELDNNTILQQPDGNIAYGNVTRPELSLYQSQRLLLDKQESSITAKNLPQIGLFAQGGYGRPGLNMLDTKFKLFAIGGVKLSWNFGNLYTKTNERKLIVNNKNSIDVQQDVFLFNTNVQLTQQQFEIQKAQKLLAKDNEIIQLRNRVRKAGESKYKNGIYQTNELIRDINAENQAMQARALHNIQYLASIYNYKYIQGN